MRKGVVYNEMKGSLSSPNSRLFDALMQSLMPDTIYGYNFGGDPEVIPELTHEGLLDFHRTFYHPGRCLFFFYGNMPLENHLQFIEEKVLSGIEKPPILPPVGLQKRFTSPVILKKPFPVPPGDKKDDETIIALSWLTADILEQEELLALSALEIILLGNDASPLRLALLESGMCRQVMAYVDNEMREAPFIIILKGCREENREALEKLIEKKLAEITSAGIEERFIDAAIHQLEIARSEIGDDDYPFGISLFQRCAPIKQHGGNIEDGLLIHSLFEAFRNGFRLHRPDARAILDT